MWSSKWSVVKVLYLLVRYLPFMDVIILLACQYYFSAFSGTLDLIWVDEISPGFSPIACKAIYTYISGEFDPNPGILFD